MGFGTGNSEFDDLDNADAFAVDRMGSVYIADSDQIHFYRLDGRFVRRIDAANLTSDASETADSWILPPQLQPREPLACLWRNAGIFQEKRPKQNGTRHEKTQKHTILLLQASQASHFEPLRRSRVSFKQICRLSGRIDISNTRGNHFQYASNGNNPTGYYLVHAYNTSPVFTFMERTFFSTPYYTGSVELKDTGRVAHQCQRDIQEVYNRQSHAGGRLKLTKLA